MSSRAHDNRDLTKREAYLEARVEALRRELDKVYAENKLLQDENAMLLRERQKGNKDLELALMNVETLVAELENRRRAITQGNLGKEHV